jgi:hypothetical protein
VIAKLKETIILTASYYGKALSEPVLAMYVDDLSDLPTGDVIAAYRDYRRNPKNVHFPLPAQIRGIVQPVVDPDSASREVAARINGAIVKFGSWRGEDARAYIGTVGWSIVESYGGWSALCENHGLSIDPGQFLAQARELAKARIIHSPTAIANVIGIETKRTGQLTAAKDIKLPVGTEPA